MKTERFIGPCSKYVDGQGWTTEIPVKMLEEKGYVKVEKKQEKTICKCYHKTEKKYYLFDPVTGQRIPQKYTTGECWGTKECAECRCEGDESKCDFYGYKREKKK